MKYFGGYGVDEIDKMNPNERDVFFYMLQETLKEKNKQNQRNAMSATRIQGDMF